VAEFGAADIQETRSVQFGAQPFIVPHLTVWGCQAPALTHCLS